MKIKKEESRGARTFRQTRMTAAGVITSKHVGRPGVGEGPGEKVRDDGIGRRRRGEKLRGAGSCPGG